MPKLSYRKALLEALDEEMQRDERVILIGEEVAQYDGAYKISQGLWKKYGDFRVIDTPIAELGFTGVAVGAAMGGLKPVLEWMNFEFGLLALDQIINQAAKIRYMSGGQLSIPLVIRGCNGPVQSLGAQHSSSLAGLLTHTPGLCVVAPSFPYDAKGLLKTAIRSSNPIVVLESELLYNTQGNVPKEDYTVPLGRSRIVRSGRDITLIAYSRGVFHALEAAEELLSYNIDAEVIDLRSLWPLDKDCLVDSLKTKHRGVIIDEDSPRVSVASWLQGLLHYECFAYLDAPLELVAAEDVPMPYSPLLERHVQINSQKIVKAALQTFGKRIKPSH